MSPTVNILIAIPIPFPETPGNMSEEFKLGIEKPVSFWNRAVKCNFRDFAVALGKGGADAWLQNWTGLVADATACVKAVGFHDNPAALGW